MPQQPSDQTWVLFAANVDERLFQQTFDPNRNAQKVNQYRIDQIIPVTGPPQPGLAPASTMVRAESKQPLLSGQTPLSARSHGAVVFQGVTQRLHYTSAAQQTELDQRSRSELEPALDTKTVLIPIRKSPAWWQLAEDQQLAHFQPQREQPGHTAIGLSFVDRVYRKLYHSREAVPGAAYDFLTYFEFSQVHRDDFNRLLHELRDTRRNPEWRYTELEYEIWMTKLG